MSRSCTLRTHYGAGASPPQEVCPVEHRDRIVRLWNRLEAAITHHKNAHDDMALFVEEADAALWKVRDKILKDYAEGEG